MKHVKTLLLVISGAVLFSFSHPGFIFENGLGFLGFFSLIPVFISIQRMSLKSAWLWGMFYGGLSYGLLCYWLASFNPYTIYIGVLGFALIMALVFELLKLSGTLFPKKSPYAMALLWCVYEYLKTKGFLGFSYGILGYSQWKNCLLLQSASLFGVWGVSALCVFTSAFFSSIILSAVSLCEDGKKSLAGKNLPAALKSEMIPAVILCASFTFLFVYGAARLSLCGKKSSGKSVSVACIQNNTDSDKYGFDVYKRDVENLIELSGKALAEHPDVELVVWPETAVVPPIVFHYTRKLDEKRVRMIEKLLDFMEKSGRAFVIGNQMSVDNGGEYNDDYNAALLFDSEKNNIMPPEPETYYKMHLVPFTEYFPYGKIAPKLYKMLLMGDTHLWTPGTEAKVFSSRGLDFSVPICFEDSFGSLCRSFVKNGARCFVNISNDSWSSSNPCQIQHLSMSVFRSAECAVPSVRSTASGISCFVDLCGRVSRRSEPFAMNYTVCDVPVLESYAPTLYVRLGDWLPCLESLVLAMILIRRVFSLIFMRAREKNARNSSKKARQMNKNS